MTAQKPAFLGQTEGMGLRISDEELEKLQEIHELINLLFRQLPITAQQAAGAPRIPVLPAVPYSYSFFGFPWG